MNIYLAHYHSKKLNTRHNPADHGQNGTGSPGPENSDQKVFGCRSERVAVKPNHLIPFISCENKSKSILYMRGN